MRSEMSIFSSLGKPGFLSEVQAFIAITRREWMIFRRYPSWIIALLIWPLIFPMMYILTGRALSGPDGSGLRRLVISTRHRERPDPPIRKAG